MELSFTLNGREVTHSSEPKRPAVEVLREDFGLSSLKPGCSPQGICGSCAAQLNGRLRLTCTLPFKSLAGKEVRTLEGLDEDRRLALAGAFEGATLCAYGTPGLVAHAALIGDGDVGRALHMHSCRTSWPHVRQAIARIGEGGAADDPSVALGEEPFVGDLERPAMLHGALVFPPLACGRLKVDSTAVEGATVFGPGSLGLRPDGVCLLTDSPQHAGQPVALVLAESRLAARAGAQAVVLEVKKAGGRFDPARSRVVMGSARDEDGNPLAPMARSVRVAMTFAATDPGCIEPEGALAVPTQDGLALYVNGSCAPRERDCAATAAGLEPEQVAVEIVGPGALLGGRDPALVGPYAAAAAAKTGRPVKLCLSLEEGMAVHARRHPCTVELTLGSAEDGTFSHLHCEVEADAGCEGDSEGFCARVMVHASGPYAIPNRSITARAMETNNPPAGEVLGDGAVQVAAALELAVDALAAELGIDPGALRRKNLAPDCGVVADLLDAGATAVAVQRQVRGPEVGRVEGVAGCRVALDDEGAVEAVEVWASEPDPARAVALASAGLGQALTEELLVDEGRVDGRLRNIGLIKARDLPEIRFRALATAACNRADTALLCAVPAAMTQAVSAFEGDRRSAWPMKDAEAAYSVGVRRPRKRG